MFIVQLHWCLQLSSTSIDCLCVMLPHGPRHRKTTWDAEKNWSNVVTRGKAELKGGRGYEQGQKRCENSGQEQEEELKEETYHPLPQETKDGHGREPQQTQWFETFLRWGNGPLAYSSIHMPSWAAPLISRYPPPPCLSYVLI